MADYYAVDKVSQMLNMHPKTIRRYIREGKLRANKVGKSWRITGHDLSVFTEGGNYTQASDTNKPMTNSVSSVIDIDVQSIDDSIRIVNTLTAAMNSKDSKYGKSSMSTQYIEPENKVRIMLWGSIEFTEIMLSFLSSLIESR